MPNFQQWRGFTDGRFGYGAMLNGFLEHVPKGVRLDDKASVSVHMGVPYSCDRFLQGQHKVLFTMWETGILPTRFGTWTRQYDQVLVPCEHNVEVFAPFNKNVSAVPLGVDTAIWYPQDRPENARFRFHAGGSLWGRKGLDLVVDAFLKLNLDAELHIKLAPHAKDMPKQEKHPDIFFHREWMTLSDQVTWFRQSDCFVAPARGEGFGLMPLQAIACGVPTVLTATSGQQQFSHLGIVIPHKQTLLPHAPHLGEWSQASVDDVASAMLDVYENPVKRRTEARKRSLLVGQFSWAKAAEKLVKACPTGTLLHGDDTKDVQIGVMMEMQVNRAVSPDIAYKSYRFVPGVTYTVPEGVVEVLTEAGYAVVH